MHSCPNCGQACHCSGDIEDHDTGPEFEAVCTCCDHEYDLENQDDIQPDDNQTMSTTEQPKTPRTDAKVLIDAQNNWSEDEAALTAESFAIRKENGYTKEENEARLLKDIAHMERVFKEQPDWLELTMRYHRKLRTFPDLFT